MTATPTLFTVSGTPVDFFPLSTSWPSTESCSSYIYRQLDGHFIAWDPFYGSNLDTNAASCQAPQVTSWWNQVTNAATSTALGPSFVCPEAYTAAQTLLVATSTQHIYCCPSLYTFVVAQADTPAFPSQCISHVIPGETLAFLSLNIVSGVTSATTITSTADTSTITVIGIPVNGYDVQSTSSSTSAAATGASTTTGTGSTSVTAIPPATASASAGVPLATSVGASIGVVFGVLIAAVVGFLLWRRRWRSKVQREDHELPITEAPTTQEIWKFSGGDNFTQHTDGGDSTLYTAGGNSTQYSASGSLTQGGVHELSGQKSVHELSGNEQAGYELSGNDRPGKGQRAY
ncbi:hypothetical protein BJ170DRAFT_698428 [Xylariales sp. AK1849]|nr:hypothetical protein BJ170DRAFT_698428 [Xylariales sp. AK1849]